MANLNGKALGDSGLQHLWDCLKAILSGKADTSAIPTKLSQIENDILNNVDNVKQYSASNPPPYPVNSVNGNTGAVMIDIPSSPEDIGLGNVDNVKQYSASNPPPYPVTSVNGQTGAVSIDIPVPEDEIFWAVVEETTNAEIEAAYEAGKLPCIRYDGVIYSTFTRYNATTHVFSYVHEAGLLQVGCMAGTWTSVGTRFLNMPEFTEMHNALADRVTDLEEFTESDPTVPAWAKASSKPTYTAAEVGALPTSAIGYGTSDLTAGSSALTTGNVYLVYE